MRRVLHSFGFSCSKSGKHTCHACRLGKHVRLPFTTSNNVSSSPFDLLHCDVWTSPITSNSGFQFYLVVLDDYSHYVWTFPLRHKSDVLPTLISFHAFVRTQFQRDIKCFHTHNGRKFDSTATRAFCTTHGISLRLTCPYTSQQNGRAERVLRTINDSVRALLFHASVPPRFWPDALSTATYLINRRPCRPRAQQTPHELLFGVPPTYEHLRTFGCLCYPNTAATAPHKLAPRSIKCIFLGYPAEQRGYRCYDPESRRVLTSRHVYFDENVFPFAQELPVPATVSTARSQPLHQDVMILPPPRRQQAAGAPAPQPVISTTSAS